MLNQWCMRTNATIVTASRSQRCGPSGRWCLVAGAAVPQRRRARRIRSKAAVARSRRAPDCICARDSGTRRTRSRKRSRTRTAATGTPSCTGRSPTRETRRIGSGRSGSTRSSPPWRERAAEIEPALAAAGTRSRSSSYCETARRAARQRNRAARARDLRADRVGAAVRLLRLTQPAADELLRIALRGRRLGPNFLAALDVRGMTPDGGRAQLEPPLARFQPQRRPQPRDVNFGALFEPDARRLFQQLSGERPLLQLLRVRRGRLGFRPVALPRAPLLLGGSLPSSCDSRLFRLFSRLSRKLIHLQFRRHGPQCASHGSMEPMPDRTQERLKNLRNGLLRLHKSLLDSERAVYERDVARITSTRPVSRTGAQRSVVRLAARAIAVHRRDRRDAGCRGARDTRRRRPPHRAGARPGRPERRRRRIRAANISRPCSGIRTWCWRIAT